MLATNNLLDELGKRLEEHASTAERLTEDKRFVDSLITKDAHSKLVQAVLKAMREYDAETKRIA